MARYVITGGLGVGKTSIISLLKETMVTVGEPARKLIAEHRAVTVDSTLEEDPELFVARLIVKSIEDYQSASTEAITVFDRGLPDCVAYAAIYGIDTGPAMAAAIANRYEDPVFVAPPWREIFVNDEMRKATFAQAESFFSEVVTVYYALGYELIELPKVSVEERAALVESHLA